MAYRPDYSPIVQASGRQAQVLTGLGGKIGGAIKSGRQERKEEARLSGIKGLASQAMGGNIAAQDELAYTSPEISKAIMERLGAKTEQQQKAAIYDFAEVSSLHGSGQPEAALGYLDQRIAAIDESGDPTRNSKQTRAIRDMYAANPEKGAQYINMSLRAMIDPKEFAKSMAPGAEEGVKVGAQEILEDGTIIQSTAKGPVVWSPTGKKVTGQAAADAVTLARAEKVSNLREAAGEKKRASLEAEGDLKGKVEANVISAKEAAKISIKAFDRLEKININIDNMNEGIQLLEDGAETGVVLKMLPSVRKNAIKLNNLQGRLGLDVLHSTTFGALSAAELKFALSTALPDKLKPEDLKDWMIQRRDAQEKLADYIEASAIFLGTPGNTVKDWMVLQREKRTARQETPEVVAEQPATTVQTMSTEDLMRSAMGAQ